MDILIARNGCTRYEAFMDLRTAATRIELTIDELSECLVADQNLR
jgi:AmiR/NasT family two-component response regulator